MTLLFIHSCQEMQVVSLLLDLTALIYWKKKGAFKVKSKGMKITLLQLMLQPFHIRIPVLPLDSEGPFKSWGGIYCTCVSLRARTTISLIPSPSTSGRVAAGAARMPLERWMEFSVQMVSPVGRTGWKRPAALGETAVIPRRFHKIFLKEWAREMVFPILWEEERQAYKLEHAAVGSKVFHPAFLQTVFESHLKTCCTSFLAFL